MSSLPESAHVIKEVLILGGHSVLVVSKTSAPNSRQPQILSVVTLMSFPVDANRTRLCYTHWITGDSTMNLPRFEGSFIWNLIQLTMTLDGRFQETSFMTSFCQDHDDSGGKSSE